jgi:hypothetical protein
MDTNSTSNLAECYNGNPPVIERPIGVVAEAIHQRIVAEQQKLAAEELNEKNLTTQRIALLTDGSDVDVDTCEIKIDQSRSAQLRSLERIELLADQLKQANRAMEEQRFADLAAGAERARQRGVAIITKTYPKLAKQLGEALAELKECEATIWSANHELTTAKRTDSVVESPNASRFTRTPLHDDVNLPSELDDGKFYWERYDGALEAIRNRFAIR